jgi:hypothetical protein
MPTERNPEQSAQGALFLGTQLIAFDLVRGERVAGEAGRFRGLD